MPGPLAAADAALVAFEEHMPIDDDDEKEEEEPIAADVDMHAPEALSLLVLLMVFTLGFCSNN